MEIAAEHERRIPTRADDPIPLLFWEPFEFILAVTAFGGIMILVNPIAAAVVSAFVLWGAKRLKRGAKRGASQHALWAFGAARDSGMSRFPHSTTTEFIE